jgi:two-component system cell cycle response regulator
MNPFVSRDTNRDSPLRRHFRKREDPYAGADNERAVRLSGALWLLGALLVLALLPVAPPTAAEGSAGWAIAGVLVLGAVAAAARCFVAKERVGYNELIATSYVSLTSIAVMEWLAGGRTSPYHQLFLLGVLHTASAHPPRRFAVYFAAYLAAVAAPFVYGASNATQVGDAALQVFLTLGFAMLASIQMTAVREQRLAMREQGEADRRAAETDPLTGLGNRRALMAELERTAADACPERPLVLALFDLDGFKAYNDAFGHPAGDALLTRLAGRLDSAVSAHGRAYRMGGDEFCLLAALTPAQALDLVEAASTALTDEGDGFSIGASRGTALMPTDTRDAHEALRIADTRMYARKNLGRTSAGRQSADVLLSVLSERDPVLGEHIDGVAELCVAVGRKLDMDDGELLALRSAGALHDIGKLAVPDAILSKVGPLTEAEWEFVRRHTVIGERILRAAPALAPVAPLVRASHEHFDGRGYPDALAGEQIPLASRIISVCDAFDAMVSARPYRTAMSQEGAIDELRACSGSQFDPMVVAAFEAALRERRPAAEAAL